MIYRITKHQTDFEHPSFAYEKEKNYKNIVLCHSCAKPSSESFFPPYYHLKDGMGQFLEFQTRSVSKIPNGLIYHCNTLIDYGTHVYVMLLCQKTVLKTKSSFSSL